MKPIKNKKLFYLLSFTWGLPMTLIGLLVALILIISGKKIKKWGYCYYFNIGKNWGGQELGIIFLTDKDDLDRIKNHEHGHAFQNCYFGPLMLFIVCIPSFIRYWYRHLKTKLNLTNKKLYESIWFERDATKLGFEFMNYYKNNQSIHNI